MGVEMTRSQPDHLPAADEAVRDGAVRWLLWLRAGDASAAEFDAFERWCAQSRRHADAVYDVMWLWALLGMLGTQDGGPIVH
ncbi:hypothetical protein LIG30_2644 [Burkholderia sp. lig30]|jgi:ferric-dicitrate binding protein FerR (iron transport regulator)|nr:hypothetical protein LIG30_2644 [Burkholderia sp. lig30]